MRVRIRSSAVRGSLVLLLSHLPAQFATADTYGSGWYGELELSVGQEENVAHSYKSADVTGDRTVALTLGAGYGSNLGDAVRYVVSGYASWNRHDEFDELDSLALSLGTSLTYQPRGGFKSPWYTATAEITRLEHADSEARDGYLLGGTLAVNRRFGMKSVGRIGYRYQDFEFLSKSDADSTRDAAFDVARHEIFLGADVNLAPRTYLLLEYAFQRGDFTTSVSGWYPGLAYDAWTWDPVFQSCSQDGCTGYYAYRSEADVHVADVGIAFSTGRVDYDLSVRFVHANSDAGVSYDDRIAQAGLIWSF